MTIMPINSAEHGKEPRKQSMLYEVCPHCGGKGGSLQGQNMAMPCCKMLGVVETGATAGQLEYMAKLDTLRQEAGISAAMLRDGRVKGMMEAFRTILRWCDRGGEEPEGHCLHEIENQCWKVLGLAGLTVADLVKPLPVKYHGCRKCGEERMPRLVAGRLTCPECGSEEIVPIS